MSDQKVSRRKFLAMSAATAGALASPFAFGSSDSSKNRVLRVGWVSEPDLLNPFTFQSSAANELVLLIYDQLIEYDTQLKPIPALAESWSYSADGKSITYKLRSGIKWHDGTPFSADDVKYTWEVTAKHNLGQAAQYLGDLISVDIIDATTVTAKFKRPQAFDPALIIPIVPKHIWGSMSADEIQKFSNSNPIGTGPYKFGSWKKGSFVEVKRNNAWWGSSPAASAITWVHFDNPDVMTQGLISGEVDVLSQVPPLLWNGLHGKSHVKPIEMESYSFHHIGMNVSKNPKSGGNPLLLDKTIRQALSYSLDRSQLVRLALAGHGIPGSTILPAAFDEWQLKIPKSEQLDANPSKAKEMLDAAGYKMGPNGIRVSPQGKPLSFRLIAIQATDVDVRAAQIFVSAAAAVGIQLKLQTLDETTLGNIVYNASAPNWDLFVWGWDSGTPDPDYMLGVPLTSQIGNNNDVYYSNPRYDSLYEQQATTVDKSARLPIVHEMQHMYYYDAAYIIMWYQSKLQAYRTDTWKGWVNTRGGMIFNFTRGNYLNVEPV